MPLTASIKVTCSKKGFQKLNSYIRSYKSKKGLMFLRMESGYAVFESGSGVYTFNAVVK